MNEKNIVRMKACIYAKSSLRIDPKEKPYEKIGWGWNDSKRERERGGGKGRIKFAEDGSENMERDIR